MTNLLRRLGVKCCGAATVSDCHQRGLCWMDGTHPDSPGFRPASPPAGAETAEPFGDWVKAIIRGGLARHGRTQADMARALGLSQKHVSQVVTGRVSGSLDTINAMLRYADPDHSGYGRPLPATPYGSPPAGAEADAEPAPPTDGLREAQAEPAEHHDISYSWPHHDLFRADCSCGWVSASPDRDLVEARVDEHDGLTDDGIDWAEVAWDDREQQDADARVAALRAGGGA